MKKQGLLKIFFGEFGIDGFVNKETKLGVLSIIPTIILTIFMFLFLALSIASVVLSLFFTNMFESQKPSPDERFVPAKIFKAGSGFLDGTKKYQGVSYDKKKELPYFGYESDKRYIPKEYVLDLKVYKKADLFGTGSSNEYVCNFTLDVYGYTYGNKEMVVEVTTDRLLEYKEKGYCDFKLYDLANTFTVLDEKCPIVEIKSAKNVGSISAGIIELDCIVKGYLWISDSDGNPKYTSMPIVIFGTDDIGRNLMPHVVSRISIISFVLNLTLSIMCLIGLLINKVKHVVDGINILAKKNKIKEE